MSHDMFRARDEEVMEIAREVKGQKRARQQQIREARVRNLDRARAISKFDASIPSAVIAMIGYDKSSETLVIDFLGGDRRTYVNINPTLAESVIEGWHACTTTGSNMYGAWYKGKFPSRGSSVWWLLGGYAYY